MGESNGGEAPQLSIEELAAQMLGLDQQEEATSEPEADDFTGHPAWNSILSQIPKEFHAQVMPTLAEWDAGVSRRFQKIHDEYSPYKEFAEYDPNSVREAVKLYESLTNDPETTWETIGRVFGLSPQQVSQAASLDDEDDFDYDSLPKSVRDRLARIDQHDSVLGALAQQMAEQQEAAEKEAEDEALNEILSELAETYGDFDEDYVVGLIASGVDPEEAVEHFQEIAQRISGAVGNGQQQQLPRVMSSSGGIPNADRVDVNHMSNQDTQSLIAEILRLSSQEA